MLDVPDVELDALVPRKPCATGDLRPPGDAGLDVQTAPLPRRVLLDLIRERGAGPDEAHVAASDVPELRDLVDGQAAQHPADACDPRVSLVDGVPGAPLLGA